MTYWQLQLVTQFLANVLMLTNKASNLVTFSFLYRKWSFIIDQRTLKLAYKQLQLHGNNFMGFFIGDIMSQNNGKIF